VVAVPKTMDNDILWVWQSFGFFSTVEKAREVLVQLATETMSNPRLCIVQLFGSNSGFVVSHAALASGICDLILTPEVEFSVKGISQYIRERLSNRLHPQERLETALQRPYGLIVMAETAIPTDVEEYLDDRDIGLSDAEREAILLFRKNGCRVQGQTPDALRSAALKIVSAVLQRDINADAADDEYWSGFRVFSNEPRHLIRSIPPSATDVIFGHRLGALAVDNAMAGSTDFMVSQWLTEYVLVPLKLVVLGRKRVPSTGFFWKTVIASTGQPEQL
jgi:6-phosphofructokinase 1